MSSRRACGALVLLAVGLAVAALAWVSDNPEIDGTSMGSFQCLAPWDTVLNGAGNHPGGDPPPDGESIAERCVDAGRARYAQAKAVGAAAGVALLAAGGLAVAGVFRRHRRRRAPGVAPLSGS